MFGCHCFLFSFCIADEFFVFVPFVYVFFSHRLILATVSTVTTFHQIRLINQRFGLKPGQAGNMRKPHLRFRCQSLFRAGWWCCLNNRCRFTEFGGPAAYRPVEDLAYSVAKFIMKGGSFVNYYMVRFLLGTLWILLILPCIHRLFVYFCSITEAQTLAGHLEVLLLPLATTMTLLLMNLVRTRLTWLPFLA